MGRRVRVVGKWLCQWQRVGRRVKGCMRAAVAEVVMGMVVGFPGAAQQWLCLLLLIPSVARGRGKQQHWHQRTPPPPLPLPLPLPLLLSPPPLPSRTLTCKCTRRRSM